METINQTVNGGIGNNNIVQLGGGKDAAAAVDGNGCSVLAMDVMHTIIGSYVPCDSDDPTEVEFLSTEGIRVMVAATVGFELPLSVIFVALTEAGFVARLCDVQGISKGIYFLALPINDKKPL
jgi:hypothetical protein